MTGDHAAPRRRALLSTRGLVLLVVVGGLLFSSVYPMQRYFNVRSEIESLREEERRLDARVDELLAERDALKSDAEVERRARAALGMVRPGEIPFVIATPLAQAPAPAPVDPGGLRPADTPDEPSVMARWWHALTRAVGS